MPLGFEPTIFGLLANILTIKLPQKIKIIKLTYLYQDILIDQSSIYKKTLQVLLCIGLFQIFSLQQIKCDICNYIHTSITYSYRKLKYLKFEGNDVDFACLEQIQFHNYICFAITVEIQFNGAITLMDFSS